MLQTHEMTVLIISYSWTFQLYIPLSGENIWQI